jgi:ABC-type transport system substrate-binding protein
MLFFVLLVRGWSKDEFKANEYIKVARNPDYWKPGRPYLDGVEYPIMREIAPRNLAFFAGKFDAIPLGETIPTLKDFTRSRRRRRSARRMSATCRARC